MPGDGAFWINGTTWTSASTANAQFYYPPIVGQAPEPEEKKKEESPVEWLRRRVNEVCELATA